MGWQLILTLVLPWSDNGIQETKPDPIWFDSRARCMAAAKSISEIFPFIFFEPNDGLGSLAVRSTVRCAPEPDDGTPEYPPRES